MKTLKNLSLFQLSGASKIIIDNFFIDNDYKIYKTTFIDSPDTQLVLYKLQSCIINYVECLFCNNKLQTINFSIDENYIKTMY